MSSFRFLQIGNFNVLILLDIDERIRQVKSFDNKQGNYNNEV